jgi:hypothetical protein
MLVEQAATDRTHLVPGILGEAGARLAGEGEGSARAYLAELGWLDPRLPGEIAGEIERLQASGSPAADDLSRLLTNDN